MRKSEALTAFRILMAVAGVAAVTSCGSSHPAAQASPTFSVHAATVKACKALSAWENSPGTNGPTFNNSSASAAVENDAENTPFEGDLQAWVSDMDNGLNATQDADKVGADCGAVGIAIFGSGS